LGGGKQKWKENEVVNRMFGPKRVELAEEWRNWNGRGAPHTL
jgi:hypothetical protein